MASNVEYYERQKELQEGIDECERERQRLDQQLRTHMQSDDRLAKLKAVKLQNYWKKICDDEKRSKQRNEQLLREFERIDSHLSSMDARLEKLQLLKRQYEDHIERQYPNWKVIALEQQKAAEAPAESPRSAALDPQVQTSHSALAAHSPRQTFSQSEQAHLLHVHDRRGEGGREVAGGGEGKPPAMPRESRSGTTVQFQLSPSKAPLPPDILHRRSDSNGSLHAEDLLPHEASPQRTAPTPPYGGDRVMERSEVTSSQQSVGQRVTTVVHVPSGLQPSAMGLEDQDEESDSLSEPDSPQRDHTAPYRAAQRGETTPRQGASELSQAGLQFLLDLLEREMRSGMSLEGLYRSHRPDSTSKQSLLVAANAGHLPPPPHLAPEQVSMVLLEQLMLAVQRLPERCLLSEALLSQPLSSLSELAVRRSLPPQAQELWSSLFQHMTLLVQFQAMREQEVASIFVPCLVRVGSASQGHAHALLVRLLQTAVATQEQTTPPDNRVASPRGQGERTPGHMTGVASPRESGALLDTGGTGTGSLTDSGHIPPLQFGSLVEKPLSDEESVSVTTPSFQDGSALPLNQTPAYLMLTGSLKQPESPMVAAAEEETTDDDVENQLVTAISPRARLGAGSQVVAAPPSPPPSARQPTTPPKPPMAEEPSDLSSSPAPTPTHRSTTAPIYLPSSVQAAMGSTGSSMGKRQGGIKISSDLDTDSDMDMLTTKAKPAAEEEMDDFDFYD